MTTETRTLQVTLSAAPMPAHGPGPNVPLCSRELPCPECRYAELVEAISAACPHAPMAEILELANLYEALENGLAVVMMEAQ